MRVICGRCKKPTEHPGDEGLCPGCEWELEHMRLGQALMELSEEVQTVCGKLSPEAALMAEGLDMATMALVDDMSDETWRTGLSPRQQAEIVFATVKRVRRWALATRKVAQTNQAHKLIGELESVAQDAAEYEQERD